MIASSMNLFLHFPDDSNVEPGVTLYQWLAIDLSTDNPSHDQEDLHNGQALASLLYLLSHLLAFTFAS